MGVPANPCTLKRRYECKSGEASNLQVIAEPYFELGLEADTYVSAVTGNVRLAGILGVVTETGVVTDEWLLARSNASME